MKKRYLATNKKLTWEVGPRRGQETKIHEQEKNRLMRIHNGIPWSMWCLWGCDHGNGSGRLRKRCGGPLWVQLLCLYYLGANEQVTCTLIPRCVYSIWRKWRSHVCADPVTGDSGVCEVKSCTHGKVNNFLKVITMLYRVSVFLIFFFFFYTIY